MSDQHPADRMNRSFCRLYDQLRQEAGEAAEDEDYAAEDGDHAVEDGDHAVEDGDRARGANWLVRPHLANPRRSSDVES